MVMWLRGVCVCVCSYKSEGAKRMLTLKFKQAYLFQTHATNRKNDMILQNICFDNIFISNNKFLIKIYSKSLDFCETKNMSLINWNLHFIHAKLTKRNFFQNENSSKFVCRKRCKFFAYVCVPAVSQSHRLLMSQGSLKK